MGLKRAYISRFRPIGGRFEACYGRLEDRHPLARGGERVGYCCGYYGLAYLGARARYEDAAHGG
jgi:hypothetical protein